MQQQDPKQMLQENYMKTNGITSKCYKRELCKDKMELQDPKQILQERKLSID
jgi:hypothetical protein